MSSLGWMIENRIKNTLKINPNLTYMDALFLVLTGLKQVKFSIIQLSYLISHIRKGKYSPVLYLKK